MACFVDRAAGFGIIPENILARNTGSPLGFRPAGYVEPLLWPGPVTLTSTGRLLNHG